MISNTFVAAAAHVSPIYMNSVATAEKAASVIWEAAQKGAALIVFPESFIPGFPVWSAFYAPIESHEHFKRFAAASIASNGPEIQRIRQAAVKAGVFVSIGFSEKNPISAGGLWNSNMLISDTGDVLVHHRKLVPTFFEKLVWNPGDGAGLEVANTPLGRIGALICGENTNPLARYSLMAQGEQIHISSYPPIWPTRPPTDDANYDNRAANRIRAAAHCFEAKCFGITVAGCMDKNAHDDIADGNAAIAEMLERTSKAPSFFLDPTGAPIGEEMIDEGIGYAEINLAECVEPKRLHDVVAGYNRFDIFELSISRSRSEPAIFNDSRMVRQVSPMGIDVPELTAEIN